MALGEAGGLGDLGQALVQAARGDPHIVGRHRVLVDEDLAAHLHRAVAQLLGDAIEVDLQGKAGLRRAVSSLGAAGRLVGEDPDATKAIGRDLVGHRLQGAGVVGAGHAVAAVAAAVDVGLEIERQNVARFVVAAAYPDEHRVAPAVHVEDLLAGESDLDRPARHDRQLLAAELVWEWIGLAAESSPVWGRHEAYVASGHVEHLGQSLVHVVRRLGGAPDCEPPIGRVLGHG